MGTPLLIVFARVPLTKKAPFGAVFVHSGVRLVASARRATIMPRMLTIVLDPFSQK
jgi:hypothetical protein